MAKWQWGMVILLKVISTTGVKGAGPCDSDPCPDNEICEDVEPNPLICEGLAGFLGIGSNSGSGDGMCDPSFSCQPIQGGGSKTAISSEDVEDQGGEEIDDELPGTTRSSEEEDEPDHGISDVNPGYCLLQAHAGSATGKVMGQSVKRDPLACSRACLRSEECVAFYTSPSDGDSVQCYLLKQDADVLMISVNDLLYDRIRPRVEEE